MALENEKNSLVSVIIPAFNCEQYIASCIDSVISQTYKRIEIIVVDDGSTDRTGIISDEYATLYPGIVFVLHQKNAGPSVARRSGLDKATGEFVMFIDSDDQMFPECIEKSIFFCQREDCDVLQFNYTQHLNPEKNNHISKKYHITSEEKANGVDYYLSHTGKVDLLWDKIYKKSLFNVVDFPVLFYSEDAVIVLQIMLVAKTVCSCKEVLYYHNVKSDGLCRKPYSIRQIDQVEAGLMMIEITKNYGGMLLDYAKAYTCFYTVKNYAGIKKLNNDKSMLQELLYIFMRNYSFAGSIRLLINNCLSFRRFFFILMFQIHLLFCG